MNKFIAITMKNGKALMYPAHALGIESVETAPAADGREAEYSYAIKNIYTGETVGSPDEAEAKRILLQLSLSEVTR